MTMTKVMRIYLIPGKKLPALELWQKAVETGTTEQLLQTITIKEEEVDVKGLLRIAKDQIFG